MKVYTSRYALAQGLTIASICNSDAERQEGDSVLVSHSVNGDYGSMPNCPMELGVDVHLSLSGAIVAAKEMRAKKILSLENQIKKIEAIDFESQIKED